VSAHCQLQFPCGQTDLKHYINTVDSALRYCPQKRFLLKPDDSIASVNSSRLAWKSVTLTSSHWSEDFTVKKYSLTVKICNLISFSNNPTRFKTVLNKSREWIAIICPWCLLTVLVIAPLWIYLFWWFLPRTLFFLSGDHFYVPTLQNNSDGEGPERH